MGRGGETAIESRYLVERMEGLVAIRQSARTEDRRKVYEHSVVHHLRPWPKGSRTPRFSESSGVTFRTCPRCVSTSSLAVLAVLGRR